VFLKTQQFDAKFFVTTGRYHGEERDATYLRNLND
jgi:hypothetical protein